MNNKDQYKTDNCYSCYYEFDAQWNTSGKDYNPPKTGCFTICINCGSLMVFKSNGMTREATTMEKNEAIKNTTIKTATDLIKNRGLIH